MRYVTSVEYLSGYRLRIGFEDGAFRVVDLQSHLNGDVFQALRDLTRFRSARLDPELDTVVWDNGADMAPEFLYEIGVPTSEAGEQAGADSSDAPTRK